MPDLTLNLSIDAEDLRILKAAQQRIILAKPVDGGSPNVAWISFDPFEDNIVEWSEEYGMYASTTEMQSGATITKVSETEYPAQDGARYAFASSATFNGPHSDTGVSLGTYAVDNEMPASSYPSLSFGLQQKAKVNGKDSGARPLNIATVPSGHSAEFTPITTVYVWLEANIRSSTVITEVTSKQTKVTYSGDTFDHSLTYDASNGMFVPSDNALVGESVELLEPALF